MYQLWVVWRLMKSSRHFWSLTTILSLVGMMLGVASLVVAMSVVSGYETTLKHTVIDVVGHLLVMKRGEEDQRAALQEIKPYVVGLKASTPFLYSEAVLAHEGQISGVIVEGVEEETVHEVLNLKGRLIAGEFDLSSKDGISGALIGKALMKKHDLKLGDVFRVVTPIAEEFDPSHFRPHMERLYVAGVLDLGRHDYDSRYVITDLAVAQAFAQVGDRVSGYRLRLENDKDTRQSSLQILNALGYSYWTRDWQEVNRNLFEAVRLEKVVIFFVLLIMVVAASFNISSTLFVSVVQKFHDISVLKTLGASPGLILRIFTLQGLLIGFIGSLLGLALGLLACYMFLFAQDKWGLISGEIYKLDKIYVELRWLDLAAIFFASLLICFVTTLAPALRGAKLPPVEGLRYE